MKNYNHTGNHSNRMWSGLILLMIGVVFFLRNFGVEFPDGIFGWYTFLIVIGLSIGAKRKFNGGGWLAMVLVGAYFTLQSVADLNFSRYNVAVVFVALGLFLILKPNRRNKDRFEKEKPDFGSAENLNNDGGTIDENDYIDSVNVFSGSKQLIYSKNFKGGDVITVFGGCDINLSQADFEDKVVLDVVAIFGGMKIIVPPTWTVKSEVTAIFGGMDDKRSVLLPADQPRKLLIIKGIALFGGVDVRNY